ncbi:CHAD domain-containing protein [Streptomyces sp. NPDC021020]|uniref:CHAD domain-containing protein n=1 Tax=Streptomyces sp. NPDC021020 TaxID=3365109 RepID=UPI00379A3C91
MGAEAGRTATSYLEAQRGALEAMDPAVRRGEADAVHRMRVATRRARSALKSFRPELARVVTDPLAAELKWLAAELGAERDREVLAERLAARLAELDQPLPAAVRRRVNALGAGGVLAAHAAVLRTLDGARYAALLDAMDALTSAPPYRPAARLPAGPAAEATVRRDMARLRARMAAALASAPGPAQDTALHEARKAAKRARYSGEAVGRVLGGAAKAHTARMKRLQQVLGEHQDSVMCRTALEGAAADARAAGEGPAPYGAMVRAERARAALAREALPGAWAHAARAAQAGGYS